jgi:hypothetical protein
MSTKVAGADGDQRMCSQAATALSVLTFRPDQCAKDEGRDKAHERVEKSLTVNE